MIIKHFYSFNIDINKKNEKLNAQDWDRLRESEDTDFGIETSKNSYISNCKNKKHMKDMQREYVNCMEMIHYISFLLDVAKVYWSGI